MSDQDLVGRSFSDGSLTLSIEMQRRLKDSVEGLTAEEIRSRESADRLAGRVIWLTAMLVVLTAVLVALTVVLALRG